jgi:hypothetical protein
VTRAALPPDAGAAPTERVSGAPEDIKLGQWYWVSEKATERRPAHRWLGCVMHVGTNYVELQDPADGGGDRIHMERFDERCEREYDAAGVIADKIAAHQKAAALLMNDIMQLTAGLGIAPREKLAAQAETATALAVAHGTADIKAHKDALIQAQTKTLPDLFERVAEEHERMARWMKGQLLPSLAELGAMKQSTETIGDRIFTVELYAGLIEQLVQVVDGAPAPLDAKVHLFQRRHYMDEECLANYEAGGMDIRSIEKFDAWLARPDNFHRILPLPRCIVAFRVRRYEARSPVFSFGDFIAAMHMADANKTTFLYIRNGDQLFRLTTGIDFGEQLFPDREHVDLLRDGNLYVDGFKRVVSQRKYDACVQEYQESRDEFAAKLREWRRAGKPKGKRPNKWLRNEVASFERCTPDSVYFDDAMATVAQAARDHNRVAVVLQGLLDRSPALHPHPPWRLWTPEGFAAGIELIYDDSRGLTDGPPPDFEAYRAKLNASLKRGSMTVGQEDCWLRYEAVKENERRQRNSYGGYHEVEKHRPYGNPGPGLIAPVIKIGRDGSIGFAWKRQRLTSSYRKRSDTIPAHFSCPSGELLNVSAYQAGDFKIFFADPRTRAEYLEWAPLLLAAEDYVNGKGEMFSAEAQADRAIDLGADEENDEAADSE